jgi:hypothetical protein
MEFFFRHLRVFFIMGHLLQWQPVFQSETTVVSHLYLCKYLHCICLTCKSCNYNIYKTSVGTDSVQQIYALLTVSHATTAVWTPERSFTWPLPSLSLLYFMC